MFNVSPPENDNDAFNLGNKIREWIKNGKLKPGETKNDEEKNDLEESDIHKHDKEEKPKKKRGRFGFLRL